MATSGTSGKVYPVPSRATIDRVRAHKAMADELRVLERKHAGARASYLSVITLERRRQERMCEQYRWKYGPNATM